ncbi:MAG: 50S ribosomal protein L3 [Patescibacteria group bacterium]
MIGVIAQKSEMSQLTIDNGDVVGVTWLAVPTNVVVQVKTPDKDGYTAIQLGAGEPKRQSKARAGHLQNLEAKLLREITVANPDSYHQGDKVDVSVFQVGDRVMVTGISKGKGFAGTIKRHHFKSGPGSHGHDHHRQPGSIGAMGIARVLPGRRMAGHMGAERVTAKNLQIVYIDVPNQRLAIEGSVPGANKAWVLVRKNA